MANWHCFKIATAIALVALVRLPDPAVAADHRDSPTIDEYSAVDITDFFMFRQSPRTLVVALGVQSVADPSFQPSYHFQSNSVYRINFSTKSSAKPTASLDFEFSPLENQAACAAPQPACQTYTATFNFAQQRIVHGVVTPGTAAATHVAPDINTAAGNSITIFAGPREDPFFFDLVGFQRSVASGSPQFTGIDAFKGKDIDAIVVAFPIDLVFPNTCVGSLSAAGFTTPCSAWAVTFLGKPDRDTSTAGKSADRRDDDRWSTDETVNDHFKFGDSSNEDRAHDMLQVDRMGNPAVNTALISAALKDAFNFGQPDDDAADFAPVILSSILTLDKAFGTCPPSATSAAACNPNVPLLASVAVPDTLKFALNLPDGYPNGRQPADRVTDTLISLILQLPGFTDGTSAKHYCSQFPFLGPPLQQGDAAQSCP